MDRVVKMCRLFAVLGALVASPQAVSEGKEKCAVVVGPGLQRLVDLAIPDLAAKRKVDESAVELVEAQYVTWRDSSAGCPQPGMQYKQVLTNGARIVLRVDGATYHYHSGGNRSPFYCANPSSIKPLPYGPGEA